MPRAWKMIWLSGDSAIVGFSPICSRMASYLAPLLAREQGLALREDRLHGPLAAGAAEDEVDRGQPPAALQLVEHHGGI
ncbi:MAG TPA: hypothetical protein VKS62_22530, partial [Methylomirabilota bacterium]|nr:hypothetical protein [Methylomirabilota bacterium]